MGKFSMYQEHKKHLRSYTAFAGIMSVCPHTYAIVARSQMTPFAVFMRRKVETHD